MFLDTVRIWKEDNGIECEAKTSLLMSDIKNIEEYACPVDWKNRAPKTFITLKKSESIVVLYEYESLRKAWHEYRTKVFFYQINN